MATLRPSTRVDITASAEAVLLGLIDQHGPLMFHQSGGCCDGSAPMCYPRDEFRVGASDVLLGEVTAGTPFWIGADQYEYWKHTHLTVDVVSGRGSGFSLEAPRGMRFLTRSRLLTEVEFAEISRSRNGCSSTVDLRRSAFDLTRDALRREGSHESTK